MGRGVAVPLFVIGLNFENNGASPTKKFSTMMASVLCRCGETYFVLAVTK
jgi:hypothetical protein